MNSYAFILVTFIGLLVLNIFMYLVNAKYTKLPKVIMAIITTCSVLVLLLMCLALIQMHSSEARLRTGLEEVQSQQDASGQ